MRTRRTRRDEIMDFIIEHAQDNRGNSPSIREIHRQFSISYATARQHVLVLRAEGRLIMNDYNQLIVPESEWLPPPEDY